MHNLEELQIHLGKSGPNRTVVFDGQQFATHTAIYGGTGKGKSKLLELILRQLIDQKAGACIIDPHGDLVEDLIAYVLHRYDGTDAALVRRIHYFEPGSNMGRFRFDPFKYDPLPGEDYNAWLKAKVESVARTIIRKQGEAGFEGKPRLERFLTNTLYAAGVRINREGDHLGVGDALILLDPSHPQHHAIYEVVAPLLPSEIRSDFEKIRASKPRQQEDWVESTINRLRSFLSPPIRSLFNGPARETLDFRNIVQQSGIMLVNLRRTRSFTVDQGNAIGGLFINEILEAVQITERAARKPFYLFIDEASRFVGQDLMDTLAQFRKMKLSLCLAVQDLSSLKFREIDMTSKVMSQCGVQVTFQQKFPEDLDVLGQLFGYPVLDFTPLVHEVDRPDGYVTVEHTDTSASESNSRGAITNESESRRMFTGQNNLTLADGSSDSRSRSDSFSRQSKTTFLSKYRQELQETGRLKQAITDQFHRIKQMLRTLGVGQAIVSVDGTEPFPLDVHEVKSPFPSFSEEQRLELVDRYKGYLSKQHLYCFQATDENDEETRVADFVAKAARPAVPMQDENPPENEEDIFGM